MTVEASDTSGILPFNNSLFNAWPDYSFLSCIITQKEKGHDWLINHLVQTKGIVWGKFGDVSHPRLGIGYCPVGSPFRANSIFNYCPFIKRAVLPKSFIRKNYQSITDFLIEALDNGHYVWLVVDQFFSPASKGRPGRPHAVYVYGVDKLAKRIYLADNFYNGRYGTMQVDYDTMQRAFEWMERVGRYENFYDDIIMLKVIDSSYSFDSEMLGSLLNDYLNADGRLDSATRLIDPEHSQFFYGIECYSQMRQYADKLAQWPHYRGDIRSLCFLQDHANFMKLRIDYLMKHGYIKQSEVSVHVFTENARDMNIAVNLFLKYYLTKEAALLLRVCDLLDEVKMKEQAELKKVARLLLF